MDVDGDDEEDSIDSSDDDSIIIVLSAASEALAERGNKWHGVRMKWHLHVEMLIHENLVDSMSLPKFNKLLDLLSPQLKLKERYAAISSGEPIQCELMLHCMIWFLSGGSFHDIRTVALSLPLTELFGIQ